MIRIVQASDRGPFAELPTDDAAAFERKFRIACALFDDRKAFRSPLGT